VCSNEECKHVFCWEHGDACQAINNNLSADSVFQERCDAYKGDKENMEYMHKEIEEGRMKLCPHCNAPVSKNKGCNSMTCGACNQGFCWLCGVAVQDSHGFPLHFSNPTSPCYQKQFEGADMDGEEGGGLPPGAMTGCGCCYTTIVMCTLFWVLMPLFVIIFVVLVAIVIVLQILLACITPIFWRNDEAAQARFQEQVLNVTLGLLMVLLMGPVILALAPLWAPWFCWIRCLAIAHARRLAEEAAQEEMQEEAEGAGDAAPADEDEASAVLSSV